MSQAPAPVFPGDVAVRLEGVGKTFKPRLRVSRRGRRQRLETLLALVGIRFGSGASAPGAGGGTAGRMALDDITASLQRSRVTGIAGPSGCGKSVLLKLIAGVTPPSRGVIRIRGRLVKLLDIDDLNDNLTANDVLADEAADRQGIKGGSSRRMLEFAGLADFADVPVRKYSTGMRQRLAMASVLCREADVVLIDDYTAVGDLEFQRKCHERIRELAASGAAVVVASKDARLLNALCDEILWLREGTVAAIGTPEQVLGEMVADTERRSRRAELTTLDAPLEEVGVRLLAATVRNADTEAAGGFSRTTPLRLAIAVEALSDASQLRIAMTLYNSGKQVLRTVLRDRVALARGERLDAAVFLPAGTLAPGSHEVELVVEPVRPGAPSFLKLRPVLRFHIEPGEGDAPPVALFRRGGDAVVTTPDLAWTCQPSI